MNAPWRSIQLPDPLQRSTGLPERKQASGGMRASDPETPEDEAPQATARKRRRAITPHRLVCAGEELYVPRFHFWRRPIVAVSTQKRLEKIHSGDPNGHASDGYYVFISLIGIVAAMICTILVAFGIQMLA